MSKSGNIGNNISHKIDDAMAAHEHSQRYTAGNRFVAMAAFIAGANWVRSQSVNEACGPAHVTAHDLAGFETRLMNFLHSLGQAAGNDFARVERAIDEVQLEQHSILSLIEAVHGVASGDKPEDERDNLDRVNVDPAGPTTHGFRSDFSGYIRAFGGKLAEPGEFECDPPKPVERLVPRMTVGVDMAAPGTDENVWSIQITDAWGALRWVSVPKSAGYICKIEHHRGVVLVFCQGAVFKLDGSELIKL